MKHHIELKPCPFCGGRADIHKCHHSKKYYVYCVVCSVETKHYLFDKDASSAWNMRTDKK